MLAKESGQMLCDEKEVYPGFIDVDKNKLFRLSFNNITQTS